MFIYCCGGCKLYFRITWTCTVVALEVHVVKRTPDLNQNRVFKNSNTNYTKSALCDDSAST